MNKSNVFSEGLRDIEIKASTLYSTLIKEIGVFNFLNDLEGFEGKTDRQIIEEIKAEQDHLEVLPIIQFVHDSTGDVFDLYVTRVDEFGVNGIKLYDFEYKELKYSDVSGIENRLILLNEMEEFIKE